MATYHQLESDQSMQIVINAALEDIEIPPINTPEESTGSSSPTESQNGALVQHSTLDIDGLGVSSKSISSSDDLIVVIEKPTLLKRIERFVFPPETPKELQLWRWENIAIPLCYLLVGTFQGLSSSVVNAYPLEIGATEAQQTTLKVLKGLPASFKIVFGFLSDGFPIMGYRRKWYMAIGWGLASFCCFVLAFLGTPTIGALSLMVFLYSLGFWFADVIGDSLVAEKAKLEPEALRGQLQSTCYACRFFMLMVSVAFSTGMYEFVGQTFIFYTLAVIPIFTILPALYFLGEQKDVPVASISAQCSEIWNAVCSRAVWQPMGFVYMYNVLQVSNAAWNQFLFSGLGFSTFELNTFLIEAYALVFLGIMVYKHYLVNVSWRTIYIYTTFLNTIFSSFQFVLIFRLNRELGISDYLFALGDDVFAEFIQGIQFLPITIMMVHLCPAGSEGAAYAMFTTVNNAALNLAGTISTLFLGIWDVSQEKLEQDPPDVSGMWKLSLLTTCIQTAAILFVPLLPSNKEKLASLNFQENSSIGGAVFLIVLFVSLLWAVITAVLNIVDPGWAGGG